MLPVSDKPDKKKSKRFTDWVVMQYIAYVGLRSVVFTAGLIPAFIVPFFGRILGRLIQFFARKPARIARRNLELSVGIVEPDEIPAFLRKVYDRLGVAILGILRVPRSIRTGELFKIFRLENMEAFDKAREAGNGCIAVLDHLGNYESGGVVVCKAGYQLNSLARPIANPFVDRWMNGIREKTGGRIIPAAKAGREMLRVLKRNDILCTEIDIDAKDLGILVDFCGRPASTHNAFARFAIKCGSPMIVVNVYREDGVNIVRLSDPIYPHEYKDMPNGADELTRRVGAVFDGYVREHPEQWLWLLNRWRGADKILKRQAEAEAAEV